MDIDLVSIVCSEFSEALGEVLEDGDFTPQDCWDPVVEVMGAEFTSTDLAALDEPAKERLRVAFAEFFEHEEIPIVAITSALERILWRWPPEVAEG